MRSFLAKPDKSTLYDFEKNEISEKGKKWICLVLQESSSSKLLRLVGDSSGFACNDDVDLSGFCTKGLILQWINFTY